MDEMLHGGRRTRTLLRLMLVLFASAGCAPASAPTAPGNPASSGAGAAAPATTGAVAAQPAGQAAPAPPAPTHLRMGNQRLAVDVGIYIADARGYLREEGIDLELIYFANGSEMIPALATGQLEIGGGAANPATLNAIAR